mgnify:CR=1 FL=1
MVYLQCNPKGLCDEAFLIRYHAVDGFQFQFFLIDNYGCFHSFAALLLGDLSSLAPEITPKGSHSYDNPESGVTVFYGRDRGEDNINAKTFYSADKFMNEGNFQSVDYLYREKTKKWYVIDQDSNKFRELKGLIKKELKSLPTKYKSDFLALVEQQKEEKKLKINEVSLTSKPKF